MEYSEEWKTLFPITSTNATPLLLSSPVLGPLTFTPIPTTTTLLHSPLFLSPPFLSPPPSLSLPRFLHIVADILPSTSSSISTSLHHPQPHPHHNHNRLSLLPYSHHRLLLFFPTGSNLDQLGFVVLTLQPSNELVVDGSVFTSSVKFNHRIVNVCVNCHYDDGCVGLLLVYTLYSLHWFAVRDRGGDNKPGLVYLGCKLFKSSAVACACWNPHLPEECIVLLENGELFLFDVSLNLSSTKVRSRGRRIGVWFDQVGESEKSGWFSCEFSWHPRVFVVANSKAVYLLDCRFGKCHPTCLLKIDAIIMNDVVESDSFVALSKAGPDGFFFTVASEHWLLLCDVRKPLMPLLTWAHNVIEPRYMVVFPLSQLRSHPCDEVYMEASKLGFAIVLGSFWSNDFGVFCYGRLPSRAKESHPSRISKFCNSYYAWELPSNLSLDGRNCLCGSCLLKEEFVKDDIPEWIEWQQKKELVLGFCVLDEGLSSLLSQTGDYGGFTLIRLISSGKLEMQQYCASWKMAMSVAKTHEEMGLSLKNSLLTSLGDAKYNFPKRYNYFKLEYLFTHLNDDLPEVLLSNFRNASPIANGRNSLDKRFLNFWDEHLNSFGCYPPISHLSASEFFGDVSIPTSLNEIVSRVMWLKVPMDILEMAYTTYHELCATIGSQKMSLDFPLIPYTHQSPPFLFRNPSYRSNKWSSKEKPGDDFVGPVVSLSVSFVLSELLTLGISFVGKVDEFSLEKEFSLQYKSILCVAKEMSVLDSSCQQDIPDAVSLMDDSEDTFLNSSNSRAFFFYKLSSFQDELCEPHIMEDPGGFLQEGERFNTMIAKLRKNEKSEECMEKDVLKLFDEVCPVDLKFGDNNHTDVGEESIDYEQLKNYVSHWQTDFTPYKTLCARI